MADKTVYGVYYIDREVTEANREINEHAPKCDYQDEGRAEKFYLGPVGDHDGVPIFVPVSSKNKDEDKNLQSGNCYLLKAATKSGKKVCVGSLNFDYAVPVTSEDFLKPVPKENLRTNFSKAQVADCFRKKDDILKYANAYLKDDNYISPNSTKKDFDKMIDRQFEIEDERILRAEKAANAAGKTTNTPDKFKFLQSNENIQTTNKNHSDADLGF